MKKFSQIGIVILTIILCACVFPLYLIRKDANVDSRLDVIYEFSEIGGVIEQSFIAQTGYLSELAFDIAFSDGKPESGALVVQIKEVDNDNKLIAEEIIPIQNVNDSAFSYVDIHKWLKKDTLYSYTIMPQEGTDLKFKVAYTSDEDSAKGNQTLYVDNTPISGQAVTRYVYGFPLNAKNVICLWGFICLVGFMLLETVAQKGFMQENKFCRKVEGILEKWQVPILVLELIVVILMLVRISRNEAVHWDEAYTWKMVTENDFLQMLKATAADVHPPLYYALVMLSMRIFGQSIFVAKLVSVAGTAATGILGMTLVRKRWGIKTAIPFILVAGLAPQLVYYSVDVRMYSWLSFFVIAAGVFAYEIMHSGKWYWWLLFTFVSLCGVYTQYFAVIPLALIYAFLLIWILICDKKQLKKWFLCCVATVLGYMPWLSVVITTLQRDATEAKGEGIELQVRELCEWAFGNNIKFSEYLPAIVFAVSIVLFIVEYRKFSKKERSFLVLSGTMFFLSLGACALLMAKINHFWTNRYLVDTLLYLWLFILIILARKSLFTWAVGMVWLSIMVLSSYTVMRATEFNTIPWINHTKEVLAQVQDEDKIIYTFPTYDVIYEYYVPNAEFIWYEDVDFESWDKEEFYVISWGANDFPYLYYEEGFLRKEILAEMRLEEGATAELWKIRINK